MLCESSITMACSQSIRSYDSEASCWDNNLRDHKQYICAAEPFNTQGGLSSLFGSSTTTQVIVPPKYRIYTAGSMPLGSLEFESFQGPVCPAKEVAPTN